MMLLLLLLVLVMMLLVLLLRTGSRFQHDALRSRRNDRTAWRCRYVLDLQQCGGCMLLLLLLLGIIVRVCGWICGAGHQQLSGRHEKLMLLLGVRLLLLLLALMCVQRLNVQRLDQRLSVGQKDLMLVVLLLRVMMIGFGLLLLLLLMVMLDERYAIGTDLEVAVRLLRLRRVHLVLGRNLQHCRGGGVLLLLMVLLIVGD